MKKSVELPIVKPIYDVYHCQGSASAVIARNPSIRNWYLNHAIVLSCENGFLYSSSTPEVSVCCSALDTARYLDQRSVNMLYLNGYVHPVIRAMLDDGFYVYYTVIDDYFIQGKFGYKKWHFFHDGLICGYDQNEKTYSIFAYDEKDHYTVFKTPQSGFEAGRRYVKKYGGGVVGALCAIRPLDIQYELEPSTIKDNLKEYLRFTFKHFTLEPGENGYGIAVHHYLILYLQRIIDGKLPKGYLDKRAFKMIFEHKAVMLECLQALENKLHWDTDLSEQYKEILKIAERLWLRCLYYEKTQRESVLRDMCDILSQIETDEEVILSQAVQRLELADTETNKN